jgi:hypothetical protein
MNFQYKYLVRTAESWTLNDGNWQSSNITNLDIADGIVAYKFNEPCEVEIITVNDERKIVNVKYSPRKGKQFGSLFSWTDFAMQLRYCWAQDQFNDFYLTWFIEFVGLLGSTIKQHINMHLAFLFFFFPFHLNFKYKYILGPLLFLCHINDLPDAVKSQVRLFADDCLLYRPINSQKDHDRGLKLTYWFNPVTFCICNKIMVLWVVCFQLIDSCEWPFYFLKVTKILILIIYTGMWNWLLMICEHFVCKFSSQSLRGTL